MNLNGKLILITGAGGFIGSHLTERLIKEGANVRAFVTYNSHGDCGNLKFLDKNNFNKIDIIQGDLCDSNCVDKVMKDVDFVYHLGALISIPYSYYNPEGVIKNNILGTLNILQAALNNKSPRIIHTSTSEVYGTAQYVPIDEKHPNQVQSPYAASKLAADKLTESYFRSFDLPITILRPFNTYGPRQSARAIIPTIITQMLTKEEISLGSLEPIRDFIFVDDTVEGFIHATYSDSSIGKTINIGHGNPISIRELVEKISLLLDKKTRIVKDSQRLRPENSEVMELHCCNKLAKNIMNWEPTVELEQGLLSTIDWIKKNLISYQPNYYMI